MYTFTCGLLEWNSGVAARHGFGLGKLALRTHFAALVEEARNLPVGQGALTLLVGPVRGVHIHRQFFDAAGGGRVCAHGRAGVGRHGAERRPARAAAAAVDVALADGGGCL